VSAISINTFPQGTRLATVDGSLLSALFTGLTHVWTDFRERQAIDAAHRRGLRQLHELDDRMLRDIGLLRGDLPTPRPPLFSRLDTHALNLNHGWGS
jgi:hypothetical protein